MLAEDTLLSESQILRLLQATKELRKGRPIQYIIGHSDFMGLRIICDQRALIPRPETEELVKWLFDSQSELKSALDIGTGTGCIALALKKHYLEADIHALDLHSEALSLAEENSNQLGLEVHLHKDDILNTHATYEQFNLIISNPPYVRMSEKTKMRANVLDHEPHSALFVEDEDPLQFYKAILRFARENLSESGWIYFEVNESSFKAIENLMAENGFENIECQQDLYGKDRMMRGKLRS
jgi:release factor glutamine methyltransferase